ncbi:MAG: FUSC family protein [Rhizobacter sp.]|nr:FUSC family protein [Ferruginibacter sp.]
MHYTKKYINFINGRYASEGIRITAGIIAPSLVMNAFDMLPTGLIMSFGALCVSVADTPGAAKHRINGMLATSFLVAILSVMTHYVAANNILLGILLTLAGFIFSMLAVYGIRSAAVGIAALLMIVLSLQSPPHGKDIWIHAIYTLAGGTWFMLYSLVLYRLRPYKFIQQVLGDYIQDVAVYLRSRGALYAANPDYDKIHESLMQQQISAEAHQNLLSDLLFNTRRIVKESTHTGRVLIKIYLDVAELFESVMTTYQDYGVMHRQFDETGILEDYRRIILSLSDEMEEIGLAIKSGIDSQPLVATTTLIEKARARFEQLRLSHMKDEKVEEFVSLGRILRNLQDMNERLTILHRYTTYEVELKKNDANVKIYERFAESISLRPSLFFSNLNFNSNIFRHALRMALALLAGYIVSLFFKVDMGYWILLTIVVILKPAYSLSKQRNYDRLIGTAAGIAIGMLILFVIKNDNVLLGLMLFFMAGSYTFMRTNYFMSVLLMTPYLLIFFHLLYPYNLKDLMIDRLLDTAIGSVIAFIASLFLVPAWESSSIRTLMIKMIEANDKYYSLVAGSFCSAGPFNVDQIKIARKETMVALANLSDAFTRMLSEPRRFRQGIKNIHKFVVLTHNLTSHLATLSYFLQAKQNLFRSADLLPVTQQTRLHFHNSIKLLNEEEGELVKPDNSHLRKVNDGLSILVEKRKAEVALGDLETPTKKVMVDSKSVIDQFNYIFSDAAAVTKISSDYNKEMDEKQQRSFLKNPFEILNV